MYIVKKMERNLWFVVGVDVGFVESWWYCVIKCGL